MHSFLRDANPPLKLNPSVPAKSHQLSYQSYKQSAYAKQLQIQKESAMLHEIEKLSIYIKQQQKKHNEQQEQKGKHILMLSMEVQRLRAIISRLSAELQQSESNRIGIQGFYDLKVEVLKKDLHQQFMNKLDSEKQNIINDLQELSKIHNEKIMQLLESQNSKEEKVNLQIMELNDKTTKLNLLQIRLSEKERRIEKLSNIIDEKDKALIEKHEKWLNLDGKVKILQNQKQQNSEIWKKKLREEIELKEEVEKQLLREQEDIQELELQKKALLQSNAELKNQMENLLKRYNFLQKTVNQMNRKTQKNKEEKEFNRDREQSHGQRKTERQRMKENMEAYYKANSQNLKKIHELEEQLEEKENYIDQMKNEIIQLNQKLENRSNERNDQQYERKIDELTEQNKKILKDHKKKMQMLQMNISSYQEEERVKEKGFQMTLQRIHGQYTTEIQQLKKKNEELDKTLLETNAMFEEMAKNNMKK